VVVFQIGGGLIAVRLVNCFRTIALIQASY
jgi:hypothetical protein